MLQRVIAFATFNAQGLGDPAIDPNALAISALDSANEGAASYSQRSETLTAVFAPGTFITNAAPGAGAATQTLSGTSMASPYVAGVFFVDASAQSQPVGR